MDEAAKTPRGGLGHRRAPLAKHDAESVQHTVEGLPGGFARGLGRRNRIGRSLRRLKLGRPFVRLDGRLRQEWLVVRVCGHGVPGRCCSSSRI
jgi:hypothetical protein